MIPTQHELDDAHDFRRKLRYFNEVIAEIQQPLALETDDLRAMREIETVVADHMTRYRVMSEELLAAQEAVRRARLRAARVVAEYRMVRHDAATRMEQILTAVESNPRIRPTYKAGLRDMLCGGDITAPQSPRAHEFVPTSLSITGIGDVNRVTWSLPAALPNAQFEIQVAFGDGANLPQSEAFACIAVVPTACFIHPVSDVWGNSPSNNTPVYYRVRTVTPGDTPFPWSAMACAVFQHTPPGGTPAKPRPPLLSHLFEWRPSPV